MSKHDPKNHAQVNQEPEEKGFFEKAGDKIAEVFAENRTFIIGAATVAGAVGGFFLGGPAGSVALAAACFGLTKKFTDASIERNDQNKKQRGSLTGLFDNDGKEHEHAHSQENSPAKENRDVRLIERFERFLKSGAENTGMDEKQKDAMLEYVSAIKELAANPEKLASLSAKDQEQYKEELREMSLALRIPDSVMKANNAKSLSGKEAEVNHSHAPHSFVHDEEKKLADAHNGKGNAASAG